MKTININDIAPCPLCGYEPELLRNASKEFQVRCPNCNAHSAWGKKTEIVIEWYNMVIQYLRNHKEI